jgi:hypothetical protein
MIYIGNEPLQNINLNIAQEDPINMVVHSYDLNNSVELGKSVDQGQIHAQEPNLWEPMLPVLHVDPVNFLHHEIQQGDIEEALMNDFEIAQYNQNLQVGFVNLPNTLEVDPWLAAYTSNSLGNLMPHPDGIRIWGRFFAPLGDASGPQVPWSWS